jgi:hypothetical protein
MSQCGQERGVRGTEIRLALTVWIDIYKVENKEDVKGVIGSKEPIWEQHGTSG